MFLVLTLFGALLSHLIYVLTNIDYVSRLALGALALSNFNKTKIDFLLVFIFSLLFINGVYSVISFGANAIGPILFAFTLTIILNQNHTANLIKPFAFSNFLALSFAVLQLLSIEPYPGYFDTIRVGANAVFRSSGLFAEPFYYGAFGIVSYMYFLSKEKYLLSTIALVNVTLSGSLGAFVTILPLLSIIFINWLHRKVTIKKLMLSLLIASIFLYAIVQLGVLEKFIAIFNYVQEGQLRPSSALAQGILHSLPGRLGMLLAVTEVWLTDSFAFLFGKGAGFLKNTPAPHPYTVNYFVTTAPNFFLQIAVQYGFIVTAYLTYKIFHRLTQVKIISVTAVCIFGFLYLMQRPIDPIFLIFLSLIPTKVKRKSNE